MNTTDFTTTILLDQSLHKVFNAINHVSGWCQGEIKSSTTQLNDEFTYQMKEFYLSKQK